MTKLMQNTQKPKGGSTGLVSSSSEPEFYLVSLRQIVKKYENPNSTITALKGIDLHVQKGEFVAVIGKSGAGKTTLVNMMTGIDRLTSGEVWIGGIPVHQLNERKLARWRGRNVGVIFQSFCLLPTLTVLQNVMMPMDLAGLYTVRQRREKALSLLDQMGIADHAHKRPSGVSGGQQQRVAIARALANDPPLLVADEPTGSLDSSTAQSVFQVFENLIAQGKTIVMVTHDLDLSSRVTRTIKLIDGEISKEN